MRRYLELMLLHETARLYPVMCIPSAEYTYLARFVLSNTEVMSKYVDYVSELYKNLIHVFLGEPTGVDEILKKLLEVLKYEGKVLEYKLVIERDSVSAIITAMSEENAFLLSKIFEKILRQGKTQVRCLEKMIFLKVGKA